VTQAAQDMASAFRKDEHHVRSDAMPVLALGRLRRGGIIEVGADFSQQHVGDAYPIDFRRSSLHEFPKPLQEGRVQAHRCWRGPADSERRARVALSFLAKPGDPVLGAALRTRTPAELLALVTGADADGEALLAGQDEDAPLSLDILRWRDRIGEIPSTARLAAWQDAGMRLVMPGDDEWPSHLDDLGNARPLLLWARGSARVRQACEDAAAIVGSRAATGYGNHVAIEMAAHLAERGTTVVSGGSYATKSPTARTISVGTVAATCHA
jgi:hypothetical protein